MLQKFLGSSGLAKIVNDVAPLSCLDIGARSQPIEDLLPLAQAVNLYCFEPDQVECERLNQKYSHQNNSEFHKIVFFPVALGKKQQQRTLYMMKSAGSSTLLKPKAEVGEKFSRPEYVTVMSTSQVDTVPLDEFLHEQQLQDISYMKVDVEGLELEILQSASELLSSSLLVLRAEVAFIQTREEQPYYWEIASYLRKFGFEPMGFQELHHWRALTKTKFPHISKDSFPFSKGQIAHGDMLFFKSHKALSSPEQTLKATLLLLNYGYVDHAYQLISSSPSQKKQLEKQYCISLPQEFQTASLYLYKQYKQAQKTASKKAWCRYLKSLLGR